ncbi:MAG TPA: hypothetical protein VMS55_05125 [Myxococcota bacterium]|nr:hypothetical protein [Myxococcota bacterium]
MRLRLGRSLVPLFCSLCALSALAASADEITLRPRYRPGDAYVLSLSALKNSELLPRVAGKREAFREDVHLRYEANVVVLETDADGIPVRERHEDVVLSYVRPDSSGSLFDHTAYEVRRQNGSVWLFVNGERADRQVERVVAELLAGQFEYGIGALLDPGRPVAVGESWTIDPARVQKFLNARGVEKVRLDGDAHASLERNDDGPYVLRYEVPIASFEPARMPENRRAARSDGELEGEVQLEPGVLHAPLLHSSRLALHMSGNVQTYGRAYPMPWSFRSSESLDQHTVAVRREVASSF